MHRPLHPYLWLSRSVSLHANQFLPIFLVQKLPPNPRQIRLRPLPIITLTQLSSNSNKSSSLVPLCLTARRTKSTSLRKCNRSPSQLTIPMAKQMRETLMRPPLEKCLWALELRGPTLWEKPLSKCQLITTTLQPQEDTAHNLPQPTLKMPQAARTWQIARTTQRPI